MELQELLDKYSQYYCLMCNEWFIPAKGLLWDILDSLKEEIDKVIAREKGNK